MQHMISRSLQWKKSMDWTLNYCPTHRINCVQISKACCSQRKRFEATDEIISKIEGCFDELDHLFYKTTSKSWTLLASSFAMRTHSYLSKEKDLLRTGSLEHLSAYARVIKCKGSNLCLPRNCVGHPNYETTS